MAQSIPMGDMEPGKFYQRSAEFLGALFPPWRQKKREESKPMKMTGGHFTSSRLELRLDGSSGDVVPCLLLLGYFPGISLC